MTPTQRSGLAQITLIDIGIIAAGAAAFVFSFFGYYTATVSGYTRSTGAWHGFFGWFAAVLALLGAVLLVVAFAVPGHRFAPPYRTVLVLFAFATASVITALFTSGYDTSRVHSLGVAADTGHGYGYWTNLIVIVAAAAMTLLRVLQPATLGFEAAPAGSSVEGDAP